MKKGSVSGMTLFSLSIRWTAVLTVLAMAVVLSACSVFIDPTPTPYPTTPCPVPPP